MEPHGISVLLRLIRRDDGQVVKKLRTSVLATYYWCAVQSKLLAEGIVLPQIDTERTREGRKIHKEVAEARKDSVHEKEFLQQMQPFCVEIAEEGMKLARKWEDTLIENDDGGWISGHPDETKVNPDHTISLIEYKTKSSPYINWVALGPAVFQLKIYAWILEPPATLYGYRITEAQIVFLNRSGKPIGTYDVKLDFQEIESEIRRVLENLNKPLNEQIPPKKFKCRICRKEFKEVCPFQ